jgi:prolyl-tRNA editing enzyme YbaK/EbsC (Cys-tRNA(Pro) deacylase)
MMAVQSGAPADTLGFLPRIGYAAAMCAEQSAEGVVVDDKLPEGCHKVEQYLAGHNIESVVRVLADSTRTAEEAALALGCTPAQIIKSIIFRAKVSDRPVLVLTCGDRRVSEKKVAALIGERIGRADASFVQARTGFTVGGVPPFAHSEQPIVVVDISVQRFVRVWASAGSAHSMVEIATESLIRLVGGPVADVAG